MVNTTGNGFEEKSVVLVTFLDIRQVFDSSKLRKMNPVSSTFLQNSISHNQLDIST